MDLEVALPVGFAHDVDHHAQRAGRPFDQPAGEALIANTYRIWVNK
jgi:hypothetical protein